MNRKLLYIIGGIIVFLIIAFVIASKSEQNTIQNKEEYSPVSQTQGTIETKTSIPSTQYTFYQIVRVVDGDTVKINMNGKEETFRLIGLDTPETVDPRKVVQCFGIEASNKAKELLSGKKVRVETDPTQGTYDKYNRRLGYIFLEDGLFFNKYMIEAGYAHEYTYQSNPYKYKLDFIKAEKEAREQERGLWNKSTCNGDTTSSNPATSTTQTSTQTGTTGSCTIKGNISSSGKIYHMISCGSYAKTVIDETKGEKMFCSEKEALDAGWRKALNCD